ncbi:phage major capsid protein [Pseudoruegeria sp. HB172150]|uniref:phage major capsid protein n=1 Tax=Pseudoruegeria sp. HB172150 TaxID=2721164 RepID=UPI0015537468|nr:phage major capsid protein [Pseudoruegeria sp. HB172150]
MSKTECGARPGRDVPGGLSPAEAVKTELAGLVDDLGSFQAEMKAKFQQQEERIMMLDRKSLTRARPVLASAAEEEPPHSKAFAAYVRTGDDDGLRGLALEGKALATSGDGGYLVDPQTSETIQSVLNATASLRRVATVVNVEATSYDVLIDTTEAGAGWATETDPSAETGTPTIERRVIPLHELSALPKASQRLLDDSAFDLESWLAGRIAEKFARAEAAAFIGGDGNDKPTGFLDYTTATNGTETWGELGHVITGADGAFDGTDPADAIVDLVYALGAQYRANGTFVMNSKTVASVRKLKDSDGRFLWSDGLAAGEPARLMGYPVLVAEDMPDISTGSLSIAFGDFRAGYTIAERPDLRILRDPFSAKPHVLFYATKRVGGDVADFNAIKVLKFSAS